MFDADVGKLVRVEDDVCIVDALLQRLMDTIESMAPHGTLDGRQPP
jgi:hypothetical protein